MYINLNDIPDEALMDIVEWTTERLAEENEAYENLRR